MGGYLLVPTHLTKGDTMEFKDNGEIAVEKGGTKKVKCFKFTCKPIKRQLMVHEDTDKKGTTSISDVITGYRLFSLPVISQKVTPTHIKEALKKFVSHYTVEGIAAEFKRIENLLKDIRSK